MGSRYCTLAQISAYACALCCYAMHFSDATLLMIGNTKGHLAGLTENLQVKSAGHSQNRNTIAIKRAAIASESESGLPCPRLWRRVLAVAEAM